MQPKLIVEQKITAFVNRYMIYDAAADGTKGALKAFVEQKRLALKEKITFYSDEKRTAVLFTLRAEKVLDVHGRYLVEDTEGKLIGAFKKEFKQSLINSTWSILDSSDQPKLTVSESNMALAVLRRFGGQIPVVGFVFEIATAFMKYHFSLKTADGAEVGKYQKTTLFRDHYLLSVDETTYGQTDWRVFAAMSVALDALQSR